TVTVGGAGAAARGCDWPCPQAASAGAAAIISARKSFRISTLHVHNCVGSSGCGALPTLASQAHPHGGGWSHIKPLGPTRHRKGASILLFVRTFSRWGYNSA